MNEIVSPPLVHREAIVAGLRATLERGEPIIGVAASAANIAQYAENGGADIILVYESGRLRGHQTYPAGHTNELALSMAAEIIGSVRRIPVVAGVRATQIPPGNHARAIARFLNEGYAGVINFPSVGEDPARARYMEEFGLGLQHEADMIHAAREMQIFTMAYSYSPEQARRMAAAGVDVQVANAGLTVGGDMGGQREQNLLEQSLERIEEMIQVSLAENPECICLAHGGAVSGSDDTAALYSGTSAQGYVAGSSVERLPIEQAVREVVTTLQAFSPSGSVIHDIAADTREPS